MALPTSRHNLHHKHHYQYPQLSSFSLLPPIIRIICSGLYQVISIPCCILHKCILIKCGTCTVQYPHLARDSVPLAVNGMMSSLKSPSKDTGYVWNWLISLGERSNARSYFSLGLDEECLLLPRYHCQGAHSILRRLQVVSLPLSFTLARHSSSILSLIIFRVYYCRSFTVCLYRRSFETNHAFCMSQSARQILYFLLILPFLPPTLKLPFL